MVFSRLTKRVEFQNIEFVCDEPFYGAAPDPVPAVQLAPRWYKDAKPLVEGGEAWGADLNADGSVAGSSPRSTFKNCLPFLDAMTFGYVIPLWNDLICEWKNDRTYFSWPGATQLIAVHPDHQVAGIPGAEHALDKTAYKFESPWTVKTPPGYSCLFIAPLNHFEDRFQMISGVVDTDEYHTRVSFPFFWQAKELSGTIRLGDPLIQVIPFKRDRFQMTVRESTEGEQKEARRIQRLISSLAQYAYRLNFHKQKSFK